MRRYRYSYGPSSYSFGPGGISPAIKALIWINIGVFVLTNLAGSVPAPIDEGLRLLARSHDCGSILA